MRVKIHEDINKENQTECQEKFLRPNPLMASHTSYHLTLNYSPILNSIWAGGGGCQMLLILPSQSIMMNDNLLNFLNNGNKNSRETISFLFSKFPILKQFKSMKYKKKKLFLGRYGTHTFPFIHINHFCHQISIWQLPLYLSENHDLAYYSYALVCKHSWKRYESTSSYG